MILVQTLHSQNHPVEFAQMRQGRPRRGGRLLTRHSTRHIGSDAAAFSPSWSVDGFKAAFDTADVGQWTQVSVSLPANVCDQVTITYQYPEVAIAGPGGSSYRCRHAENIDHSAIGYCAAYPQDPLTGQAAD